MSATRYSDEQVAAVCAAPWGSIAAVADAVGVPLEWAYAVRARRRPAVSAPARRCPVCGEPPGKGFASYCSTEHLVYGR